MEEVKGDVNDTGFKIMHVSEIKHIINEKIEELEFLYPDVDTLVHLAREFSWNEDKM